MSGDDIVSFVRYCVIDCIACGDTHDMLGCQAEVMALCTEMGIAPNLFSSYAPGLYGWTLVKATLEHNGICVDDAQGCHS